MTTLAQIGYGNWGLNLFRTLQTLENVNLKWVSDADLTKLSFLKNRHPELRCTPVFTDVLEDPAVEGVIIATPPVTHASLAKQCLNAGKNVFVEKPMALDPKDAQDLVQLAERKGRIIMVGHLLRYHPAIIKLKELIQKGELGDIFYIYSHRLNLGTIRRHENALWNLGCHDVSVILYLTEDLPFSVSAMGKSYVHTDVEDTVFVNLYFKSKMMAHIHVSWLDPHKVRRMTVVGSRKMAVFDDMETENKIAVYDKGFIVPETGNMDVPIELRDGTKSYPHIHHQEPLRLELQHFIECVRKKKHPRTDGVEGLQVVEILTAAQESLERQGVPVPIKQAVRPAGQKNKEQNSFLYEN